MKKISLLILIFSIFIFTKANSQTDPRTFYSISIGDWNNGRIWSLSPNGAPANEIPTTIDNLVITHTITLQGTGNYTHFGKINIRVSGTRLGVLQTNQRFIFSGDSLSIAPLCSFRHTNSAGVDTAFIITPNPISPQKLPVVYCKGEIEINNEDVGLIETSILNSGILLVHDKDARLRTTGHLVNAKVMSITASSPVNSPDVEVGASAGDFKKDADLIFLDFSQTSIEVPIEVTDDMQVYGSNSSICGDTTNGSITIGSFGGNSSENKLEFFEGASFSNQICQGFKIYLQGDGTPLPIQIISFTISQNQLKWDVIEERISGYEIQHSEDIKDWISIASIESKGKGRNQYNFSIISTGYYRLKVLSKEELNFSQIIFFNGPDNVFFYPNILFAGEVVNFKGNKLIKQITIYNSNGALIQTLAAETKTAIINQTPGVYFVKIIEQDATKTSRLIIK